MARDPRSLSKQFEHIMSLETSLESDTVVYGTMLTVESKDDSITILTFEILMNPLGANVNANKMKVITKVSCRKDKNIKLLFLYD